MVLLLSGLAQGVMRAAYVHGSFREMARRALVVPLRRFRPVFDWRRLSWKALLPILAGAFLATRCREAPIMAAYFILAGAAVSAYLLVARVSSRQLVELEELVEKLCSIWVIRPQPFAALAEAMPGIGEPLHSLIGWAVRSYRIGVPTERIWAELREQAGDPALRQLVDILDWAERVGMEEAREALEELRERMNARRDLRRRSRVALALTSASTRFFQAANGMAMAVVPFVPLLRDFYARSPLRQLLFVVVGVWPLLGAFYMEREMQKLRERIV